MNLNDFFTEAELSINQDFLKNGYVIFPLKLQPHSAVDALRNSIFSYAQKSLNLKETTNIDDFFNNTQNYVPVEKLNELKLGLMSLTSKDFAFHPSIYHMAKSHLDCIVGNEICMQRSLNLSVQLPNDESALLPLHTDVWSGNSPYEVVLWLPLVDCFKTKSMYVLPLDKSREVFQNFSKYQKMDAEELFNSLKNDLVFLEVPKGHAVLFSHSILHGNIVNSEKDTRWTYNIRFKSILSPFGTKDLGEAFIPISLRPATRIGYENIIPEIHREK